MAKQLRKQEELLSTTPDVDTEETLEDGQSNAELQERLAGPMAATEAVTGELGPWASGLQPNALNDELNTEELDAILRPGGGQQSSFASTSATAGDGGSAEVVAQRASMRSSGLSDSRTTEVSKTTVVVDEAATVAANRDNLRGALVDREVALEDKRSALAQARSAGDTGRVATLEAEVTAEAEALGGLRKQIDSATTLADIEAAAAAAGVDPAELKTVDRAVSGTSLSSKESTQWSASGVTSTDSTTLENVGDGGQSASTHTRTDTTQAGFSKGELGAQRGRSETHAERRGDITESHTVDNTTRGSFGDKGVQLSHQRSETDTISDGDGSEVLRQDTMAVGGGFDGKTATGSLSSSRQGLGGAEVKTELEAAVSEDSVGVQASRSGSQTDGGEKLTYSFGGLFNLTFRVDPVPGSNPPRFQSVFAVKGGGSLGGSASSEAAHKGAGATGKGSLGGSASAALELSHTKLLSEADVSRYHLELSEWEATGKAPSGLPAFSVDRLRALAAEVSDPGVARAVVNAEVAAGMDAGESLALNVDGKVGATGELGGKMGSVGASASAGWSGSVGRDLQVSKASSGSVEVSLSFESASEIAGKLGLSVELVSASMGGKEGGSEGYSATFALDPKATAYSYSDVYSDLVGCLSAAELRGLAEDPALREAGAVKAASRKSADSESMSGSVGNQLGTVGFSQASAGSAEITESDGEVSGVFTGSNTSSVDVSSGPLQAGLESKGEARLDVSSTGELSASITDTQTTTLPTLNPSWSLSTLLKAAYPDRYQIELSDGDMQTLLARASGNPTLWQKCCPYSQHRSRGGVTTYDAWGALQARLASPVPDPLYATTQPEVATRLAQASAIAEFMRWPDAQQAVYNLCNEYGATLHSDSRDLGEQTEWPSALSDAKKSHDAATKRLADLSNQLAADETDLQNGFQRGLQRCRSIRSDLTKAKQAIVQKMSAFDHQATAVEMTARIDRQLAELDAYESDFATHFDHGESLLDGAPPTEPALLQSDPDMTEVRVLEAKLSTYVTRQNALFAEMRSHVASEVEGGFNKAWTQLTGTSWGVREAYEQLEEVYEGWRYAVLDLRKAYEAAGVAGDWKVSQDRKDARTKLEPDVATFRQIYRAAAEQHSVIEHGLPQVMTWANKYERY